MLFSMHAPAHEQRMRTAARPPHAEAATLFPQKCADSKVFMCTFTTTRMSSSAEQTSQHVLHLTQALLDAIAANDYAIYQTLCDTSLTAFEPEAEGNLVEGLDFHKFYFTAASKTPSAASDVQNTIVAPRVRLLGQTSALITYVRLTQRCER